jgi:hypothetical protein
MKRPFSPLVLALALVTTLTVAYIALIATVMSYGALTVSFSQSVRDGGAAVALLEARYLAEIADVTDVDYAALGYEKPSVETFVPGAAQTALR